MNRFGPYGLADITGALRHLTREHGARYRPFIRARRQEERIDWSFLSRCQRCRRFSINRGQLRECRYPTDGIEGLHVQVFKEWVDFHLDRVDACNRPVAHLVADTWAARGWLLGTCAGLATGRSSITAVAGLLGACVGSFMPRGEELVVFFEDLELSTAPQSTSRERARRTR